VVLAIVVPFLNAAKPVALQLCADFDRDANSGEPRFDSAAQIADGKRVGGSIPSLATILIKPFLEVLTIVLSAPCQW